jgi:hypothetical protein
MQEGVRWTNLTRPEIAARLGEEGFSVSVTVVDRLLDEAGLGYRKPQKIKTMTQHADRNAQFEHIAQLVQLYRQSGEPILSMDVKRREILGDYARAGRVLCSAPLRAWDHDFPTHSAGVVIPHGIYDPQLNEGYLHLGASHDTSAFGADCLLDYWRSYGCRRYPQAETLLVLCDAGGSNGYRRLLFKEELQRVADATGLCLRVAHYPTGCSKYNPIEHRLFPHVTRACQGVLLRGLDQVRRLIRKATTTTGLRIFVRTVRRVYETGRKTLAAAAHQLRLAFDEILPQWNYIVFPKKLWDVIKS